MKNPIAKTSVSRFVVTSLFLSLVLSACQKENLAEPSAESSDLINVPNETLATTSTTSMSTPTTLRIEAENYANMYGVITEASSEGGKNVGAISPGDWMDYSVNVPAAGSYKFNFRVAGPGGQFQLKNASGTVLATVTTPKTSGYQGYTTVSVNANLAAGQQTLRIHAVSGGYNINWFELVGGSTASTGTTSGTVRIEAENYANMYGVITEASSEGGKNVGAISPGDWMDYSVNVPAAGSYKFNFRVAGPGGQFQLKNASGTVLATVTTPKTSGYQGYTTVSVNANLAAGQQTLRIHAVSGGYNINWFELVGGSTAPTGPSTPTPPATTNPTPAPTPSGPISSNIIYRENFEGSSIWPGGLGREWNDPYSFSVVTSPSREGAKSGRFELRDGDADDMARSEVRWPSTVNGADRWFSFWVYWPSNGQATDSKPEIFHQTHQSSKTSPPMSMVIKNGKMWAEINGQVFSGVLGQGSGTITTDLGAVPKDQWVKFVFHYKFSYNTDGKWQIWKNGQQIYNYSGKTIYPPAITSSLPSFKLGIYKWPWAGSGSSDVKTRIMYVDDVRIGNEKCTYNDL